MSVFCCVMCSQLNLLEVVLDKIGNDNTCALPEELPKGDQLCSIGSNDVIFFAKQFEKCALSDMREIDRNYKILMLLLQLLNSLSVKPQYLKLLQQFPQLLENTAGRLWIWTLQFGLCKYPTPSCGMWTLMCISAICAQNSAHDEFVY